MSLLVILDILHLHELHKREEFLRLPWDVVAVYYIPVRGVNDPLLKRQIVHDLVESDIDFGWSPLRQQSHRAVHVVKWGDTKGENRVLVVTDCPSFSHPRIWHRDEMFVTLSGRKHLHQLSIGVLSLLSNERTRMWAISC
jgi:hypothetical protein